MAKIVRLTFCKNDFWLRVQERHNVVDIIPELLLEGNRRSGNDHRLFHFFVVKQDWHQIPKRFSDSDTCLDSKVLIMDESIYNLKRHILLPFPHFKPVCRGDIPEKLCYTFSNRL